MEKAAASALGPEDMRWDGACLPPLLLTMEGKQFVACKEERLGGKPFGRDGSKLLSYGGRLPAPRLTKS